ncbi:hypothetical protein C8J57DRAFT_1664557 [Mycena rebaudengoi]|nr:hypothetical protein C8J57DRAFT_1664557 [Mycena rebaudengoi]
MRFRRVKETMHYTLSNRGREYQGQNCLVRDTEGLLTFAPINRPALTLPSELISEIFLHCLPDDTEFVPPNPHAAPLLLCRICRQWKQIALATPGLWSSLSLVVEHFRPEIEDFRPERSFGDLDLVEFYCGWLANAKNTALSLEIDDDRWHTYDPLKELAGPAASELRKVLKVIRGLAAQWESVELVLHPAYFCDLVPLKGRFPWLRKFVAHRAPVIPFDELDDACIFSDAPLFRELSLEEYTAPCSSAFPWAQLTCFVADTICLSDCVNLFRLAPNLINCDVWVYSDTDPVSIAPLPPVGNLQVLSVVDSNFEEWGPFLALELLRYCTLPSLRHLSLKFPNEPAEDFTWFISFASRSSLRLEKLTLHDPASPGALMQVLQCAPSIRTLELQVSSGTVSLIVVCNQLVSHPDLLPKLESLDVDFQYSRSRRIPASASRLVDMLCSRWDRRSGGSDNGAVRLRSVVLIVPLKMAAALGGLVAADLRFQRLQREGMELYISNARPSRIKDLTC